MVSRREQNDTGEILEEKQGDTSTDMRGLSASLYHNNTARSGTHSQLTVSRVVALALHRSHMV